MRCLGRRCSREQRAAAAAARGSGRGRLTVPYFPVRVDDAAGLLGGQIVNVRGTLVLVGHGGDRSGGNKRTDGRGNESRCGATMGMGMGMGGGGSWAVETLDSNLPPPGLGRQAWNRSARDRAIAGCADPESERGGRPWGAMRLSAVRRWALLYFKPDKRAAAWMI